MSSELITISSSILAYENFKSQKIRKLTRKNYHYILSQFLSFLPSIGIEPCQATTMDLSEEWLYQYLQKLKDKSQELIKHNRSILQGWYRFVLQTYPTKQAQITSRLLSSEKARRAIQPADVETTGKVVDYVAFLSGQQPEDTDENLKTYRDRALILLLADSGMEYFLLCALYREHIDWERQRIIHPFRPGQTYPLSSRALAALQEYLSFRLDRDVLLDLPIEFVPIFYRYDRGLRKAVPFRIFTVRQIIYQKAKEALGKETEYSVTPASLHEYYLATHPVS